MQTPSQKSTPSPLGDLGRLPPELRNQIYHEVFISDELSPFRSELHVRTPNLQRIHGEHAHGNTGELYVWPATMPLPSPYREIQQFPPVVDKEELERSRHHAKLKRVARLASTPLEVHAVIHATIRDSVHCYCCWLENWETEYRWLYDSPTHLLRTSSAIRSDAHYSLGRAYSHSHVVMASEYHSGFWSFLTSTILSSRPTVRSFEIRFAWTDLKEERIHREEVQTAKLLYQNGRWDRLSDDTQIDILSDMIHEERLELWAEKFRILEHPALHKLDHLTLDFRNAIDTDKEYFECYEYGQAVLGLVSRFGPLPCGLPKHLRILARKKKVRRTVQWMLERKYGLRHPEL
ncbi:hypothetical protein MMC20_005180 [Loxospora ochrophaea]|nr:hypothetical protein [Loxospora ochrophaea]